MFNVIKANGEKEPFNEKKVLNSIRRAGITSDLQPKILAHIKEKMVDNITTTEIYRHINDYFDDTNNLYEKAKYSLKQAIMLLGPTGYPFEDYIALIFQSMGYQTQVRQLLMGKCVGHEIDVIAEKEGKRSMIEAKFHNNPGTRSEVHVPLYTKARFEDIKEKHNLDEAWIATNTKVTSDAIIYAECVGMKILSWSYPEGESLRDLIEQTGLHPITVLTSLSSGQKRTLLENHIITCREIKENPQLLNILYQSPNDQKATLQEISFICAK